MHQRGRQGSPLVRARRPHSFSLDQPGMVSSQCVLDGLQHRPQLGALGIRLDEINHPTQDGSLIGIQVTRRPLLHREMSRGNRP
jgi:hypothetical protein